MGWPNPLPVPPAAVCVSHGATSKSTLGHASVVVAPESGTPVDVEPALSNALKCPVAAPEEQSRAAPADATRSSKAASAQARTPPH